MSISSKFDQNVTFEFDKLDPFEKVLNNAKLAGVISPTVEKATEFVEVAFNQEIGE